MELWIRSQKRYNLIKVDWLKMEEVENRNYKYGDIGKPHEFAIVSNNIILGHYKTKERALEVLDEIQNILMPKSIIKFDAIVNDEDLQNFKKAFNENETIILNKATIEHLDTYVYEMPEE